MEVKVRSLEEFKEIYEVSIDSNKWNIATKNLTPGRNVHGERLVNFKGEEYRLWDPWRSKLAAAILKGLKNNPIIPGAKVLYLGAASGTTASHFSDIVGVQGHIFCIEFSPRSIRELVNNVCEYRHNISPILADARLPEQYFNLMENVDVIYSDVAQPFQAKIVIENSQTYLKKKGWVMLVLKSRSIDVAKDPSDIFDMEIEKLKESGFAVRETILLEPYEKDHALVIAGSP